MLLTSAAAVYMSIGNILHPLHNKIIYTAKPDEGQSLSKIVRPKPTTSTEIFLLGSDAVGWPDLWYMDSDFGNN